MQQIVVSRCFDLMAKYVHYTNATYFNKNNRYKNQYVSRKLRKLRIIFNLIFRPRVAFSYLNPPWMLSQSASRPNHTSYRKFYLNEFVLRDNMGSKKSASRPQKKNEAVFQCHISKIQGQGKPYNQTQLHKVNDCDFCFVSKCFHISNSRTKPAGLDF